MNPGVSQYKKCWKWDHSTHSYRVQGSKCVKYNRLQLTEHHQQFSWYCKANSKTNSSRLETKLGELCSYSLRCLNCKGDHQADSNLYLFWRHCFNKEWHSKKYQKLHESKRQLIYSSVNGNSI